MNEIIPCRNILCSVVGVGMMEGINCLVVLTDQNLTVSP